MHNNYYFLRQLTASLQQSLVGYRVDTAFSQEKDELVIPFTGETKSFYIKAILTPAFTSLSFPENFNRARANSASLFPEISGKKVLQVISHKNERSFHLELEEGYALLFKMFGNRANVVLFQGDAPIALFQNKFEKDLALRLSTMGRSLQASREQFLQQPQPVASLYPTFGDVPALYLESQGYAAAIPERKWELLEQTRHLLENPDYYYIIKLAGRTRLTLLPLGEIRATFSQPVEALQEFVRLYLTESAFEKSYQQLYQQLHKRLSGSRKFLEDLEYKMLELEYDQSFSQTADLIMANLSFIRPHDKEIEVFDFYQDKTTRIKLPEKESPQKYAERLYRKNKNRQIELRFLAERVAAKKEEIMLLENLAQQLAGISSNRELRQFSKENAFLTASKQEEPVSPFRLFEAEGFKILVGKSARNNDQLTQQHTFKEDLWLHAKDVAGSHVVIKYQSGKNFPETVIEKAAQLAAWYSKRKNDTLCPVLYTPKKYVRKPKGAEPGAVFVEREKVLLVKPENPFSKS